MMIASYSQSIFLLPLLWQLSAARPQSTTSSGACNNSPALCSKSYANITHLGAHDSAFTSNETNKYTSSGNQFYNTTTQLAAGVRLLSAQMHTTSSSTTQLRLCHTDCSLYDAGSLVSWLTEVKTWMDANPSEVVTVLIVNSVNADATRIAADFTSSGITKYAYTPTSSGALTWPTLQAMITANTRLVTFIASLPSGNAAAPYLLDEFTYVWENNYNILSSSNFTCLPDRPSAVKGSLATAKSSGRLFLMNHFLDKNQLFGQIPDVDNSGSTNSADPSTIGSLGNSAQACTTAYGQAPTFVLVDWFSVGPAIATVDGLNGVTNNIVGRTSVSQSILSQGFTGDSAIGKSKSTLAIVLAFAVAFLAGWI